jgi:predicted PurR-regulated permease PerM
MFSAISNNSGVVDFACRSGLNIFEYKQPQTLTIGTEQHSPDMKFSLSKINELLLFAVLATIVLYFGRQILIPVIFAAMLSMLMAPVCRKLDNRGFNRVSSALTCILILLTVFVLSMAIVIGQISSFADDLSLIEQKSELFFTQIKHYIEQQFRISPERQMTILKQQVKSWNQSAGSYVGNLAGGIIGMIAGLAITLVFTFLMLFHKEKYQEFFLKLNRSGDQAKTKMVLEKITHVSQQYLTGRAISMVFLFVLYAAALLIIGIKNALLLAGIASLLTIVPYVGPILGGFFPFLMALLTEDSLQPAMWVAVTLIIIQAIDNYFVEPYVLGGEVHLTALSTIIVIILGGLVWGVAGMILFIPMVAIAKIIFDNVESLKPYAYLIGDEERAPSSRLRDWFMKIFSRKKMLKK